MSRSRLTDALRRGSRLLGEVVRRAARLVRQPALWLLPFFVLSVVHLNSLGAFEAHSNIDSVSYERVAQFEGPREALGDLRTIGYPALLRLVEGRREWLKPIEYAVYLLAISWFWWAVARWFRSGWIALATALPLLWADNLEMLREIQPDFLAGALGIATMAATVLVAMHWRPALSWSILTLSLFAAYQVRPAYLFLVPLVPLLALLLRRIHGELRIERRYVTGLVTVSIAPLLAFCLLRWLVVGQFGLVAFTGFCLTGTAANFLDATQVNELPAEERAIAESVVRWRERHDWERYRGGLHVYPWHRQYTRNIYRAARPAALADLAKHPLEAATPWIALDTRLLRWSVAIIRSRPGLYLLWVRGGFLEGLRRVVERPTLRLPFFLLVISLPLTLGARRIADSDRGSWALAGIAMLCGGFFLCKLLLLAAVTVPLPRYMDAAVLLLPSLLWTELAVIWRGVLRTHGQG